MFTFTGIPNDVEIHPTVANVTANLDFLIKRDGVPQFYLEATLAMPAWDPAAGRRLAELHDTLDRMNSPDYFLEFEYRGSPEGNIRGRALRERLEAMAAATQFFLRRFPAYMKTRTTEQFRHSPGPNKAYH